MPRPIAGEVRASTDAVGGRGRRSRPDLPDLFFIYILSKSKHLQANAPCVPVIMFVLMLVWFLSGHHFPFVRTSFSPFIRRKKPVLPVRSCVRSTKV